MAGGYLSHCVLGGKNAYMRCRPILQKMLCALRKQIFASRLSEEIWSNERERVFDAPCLILFNSRSVFIEVTII